MNLFVKNYFLSFSPKRLENCNLYFLLNPTKKSQFTFVEFNLFHITNKKMETNIKSDELDFLSKSEIDELDFKNSFYNKVIFHSIRKSEILKKIRFNGLEKKEEELAGLIESLKENKSVEYLELNYYKNLITKFMPKLVDSLNMNKTITTLELVADNLGEESIILLTNCLKNNNAVKDLNLSSNKMTSGAIDSLCKLLRNNKRIKRLFLSENNLQRSDINLLCESLSDNDCLEILSLSNNSLVGSCAEKLANLISTNNSIKKLYLSNINLNDLGLKSIADSLSNNRCIQELSLNNNSLREESINNLLHSALFLNNTLQILHLLRNNLHGDMINSFISLLWENDSIISINFDFLANENHSDLLHLLFQANIKWSLALHPSLPLGWFLLNYFCNIYRF